MTRQFQRFRFDPFTRGDENNLIIVRYIIDDFLQKRLRALQRNRVDDDRGIFERFSRRRRRSNVRGQDELRAMRWIFVREIDAVFDVLSTRENDDVDIHVNDADVDVDVGIYVAFDIVISQFFESKQI